MHTSEYKRSREQSGKLDHENCAGPLIAVLQEICPDYTRMNVEWLDTGIMAKMGLPIETRVLILLASSVSRGERLLRLRSYAEAAIGLGIAKEEIVEAVLQTLPIAGFPTVIEALSSVKDLLVAPAHRTQSSVP